MQGTPFSFIGNPSAYKMTLAGDTLGNNFDSLQATLSSINQVNYQNSQGAATKGLGTIDNITEPAQYLTVSSQIPNVFSSSVSTSGQSLMYNLVPYNLYEVSNSIVRLQAQPVPKNTCLPTRQPRTTDWSVQHTRYR